jgi:alpha-tubulin suppressor-like RCC1 family protein
MPNSLPVKFIACGRDCSFAVTSDGSLFGWGINDYGQWSFSSYCPARTPTLVPLPSKVARLWVGRDHVLARTEEGELYAWGNNYSSQCGIEQSTRSIPPTKVQKLNFPEIFPGGGHNIAIDAAGTVWGWGRNSCHQLKFKREAKFSKPQQILSEPVQTAAVGLDHNLVLTKKGEVIGWGRGDSGQLGVVSNKGCNGEQKKIELPTKSRAVFLFCGAHCSAVGTKEGSLYVLGDQLLKFGESRDKNFPALIKNLTIQEPRDEIQKRWEMVGWLFLGRLEEKSILFQFPKEILFNFAHVITETKL